MNRKDFLKAGLVMIGGVWVPKQQAATIIIRGPRVAAAASFSPSDLGSALKLWLKSDGSVYNTGTTQATNGQTVETWVNAATGASDASQATSGNRPTFVTNVLNGKPAIRFDGTSDAIGGTWSYSGSTLTLYVVCSVNTDSAAYGRIVSLGDVSVQDYNNTSYAIALARDNGTQAVVAYRNSSLSSKAITYDTAFYGTSKFDGTNQTTYVNGVAGTPTASTGSFGISRYGIGANVLGLDSDFFKGDIFEVLIVDSDTSQTDVQTYLANKYAL